MTTIKINKSQDTLSIDEFFLADRRLSLRAKGFMGFLMSFDNGYHCDLLDLKTYLKEGRDAIRSILRELTECGYVTVERPRNGRVGVSAYLYTVLQLPVNMTRFQRRNDNMRTIFGYREHIAAYEGDKQKQRLAAYKQALNEMKKKGACNGRD